MTRIRRPAHRATKLTPELKDFIVQILENGAFVDAACLEAGISDSAFYEWCRRGELGEEPFRDFLDSIRGAQARAHNTVVAVAHKGAVKDPGLAMRWLQLRYARRYSAGYVEAPAQMPPDFDAQRRQGMRFRFADPEHRRQVREMLNLLALGHPVADSGETEDQPE